MQLSTLHADAECQDILQRLAAGQLTDTEARQQIAESLHRCGIADTVAREKPVRGFQLQDDIAAEMEDLLYRKVMQTTPGGFDPSIAIHASVVGWARQLLRAARDSVVRNISTRTTAKMTLIDPTPMRQWQDSAWDVGPYSAYHNAPAREQRIEGSLRASQAMEDAADWLRSKTRHLRDRSKLAAHAAAVMHACDVPALIRPRLAERKRLKAIVDANPSLAHRSVVAFRALIEGDPHEKIDEGLMALWDDYSFDQIDTIAQKPAKIALTLVDAVLSDRARPPRTVVRAFRASVKAMGTGRGWARLAEEACEVFLALEFEAYSSFDTTGSEYRDERVAGRRILCLKAPEVFNRVMAHKGQKLGATEDQVYEQLDRLIGALTDLEVKAPDLATKAEAA